MRSNLTWVIDSMRFDRGMIYATVYPESIDGHVYQIEAEIAVNWDYECIQPYIEMAHVEIRPGEWVETTNTNLIGTLDEYLYDNLCEDLHYYYSCR